MTWSSLREALRRLSRFLNAPSPGSSENPEVELERARAAALCLTEWDVYGLRRAAAFELARSFRQLDSLLSNGYRLPSAWAKYRPARAQLALPPPPRERSHRAKRRLEHPTTKR